MDRHLHKPYVPTCPRQAAIVDQYMWPQKDTNKYMCHNGISHPIYDCRGMINYTLPLEMYPPVNHVHPQIAMVRNPHLQYRGSALHRTRVGRPDLGDYAQDPGMLSQQDESEGRIEGFYLRGPYGKTYQTCPSKRGFVLATQRTQPGKLPDPSGYAAGRSACNSC